MAKQVVTARSVYVGSLDLAGNLNQIDMEVTAPEVDMTNLASGGVYEGLCGIKKITANFQGFWESAGTTGNPDAEIYSKLGTTNLVSTAMAYPPAAGDVAYFVNGLETQYTLGGMIGAAARLGVQLAGTAPLVRGKWVEIVARTATGSSAAQNFGTVAATQALALAVHVIAVSGTNPTLDILIESDEDSGFASATTRITVPQITGITSYYTTLAGPITPDDEYRVTATIGGTDTPTFTYRVALGVYSLS